MIYRIKEVPTNEGTSVHEVGKSYGRGKPPVVSGIEQINETRVLVRCDDGSTISYPVTAIAIYENQPTPKPNGE